jgi:hypothetical protein
MATQAAPSFFREIPESTGNKISHINDDILIAQNKVSGNPDASPFYRDVHVQSQQQQEEPESYLKDKLRTALQIPQGVAELTGAGAFTGLSHFLGAGEIFDPEEIERIRAISEREGIPFDEDAYLEAGRNALNFFPTVRNVGREVEKLTGIPLSPKTREQEYLRFATNVTKGLGGTKTFQPEGYAFRGTNHVLPNAVIGAGVAGAREGLVAAGVPEGIADVVSLGLIKTPTAGATATTIGTASKPSGLPTRQYEKTTAPRPTPDKKINQITNKVQKDFEKVSDKIIEKSPIGETASKLANDASYKADTKQLLNDAQTLADSMPQEISPQIYKDSLEKVSQNKPRKGFLPSEYDKSYQKFMEQLEKDAPKDNFKAGKVVEQYRKTNEELGEYFEPGASHALNRGKRDALLDSNRALVDVLEKTSPDSPLIPLFKEGNERWMRIMDAEAVDDFIKDVFPGDTINYKAVKKYFEDPSHQRQFQRALGEKGANEFEQLLTDLATTQTPYKMLRRAEGEGFKELAKTGVSFIFGKHVGVTRAGYSLIKAGLKKTLNAVLDKPQLAVTWKKAVEDLNKGKFSAAQKGFSKLSEEAKILPRQTKSSQKVEPNTIEVKAKPIQAPPSSPSSAVGQDMKQAFSTMKGASAQKLYEGIFNSLEKGKSTFAGIRDPLIQKAKPYFDKGYIKSPEDLKEFVNNFQSFINKHQKKSNPQK